VTHARCGAMVRTCFLGCEDFDRADAARFEGNLAKHKQAVGDRCAEISMAISKAPIAGVGVPFRKEEDFMTSRVAEPVPTVDRQGGDRSAGGRRNRGKGRCRCQ
jgi:hypothetical protein